MTTKPQLGLVEFVTLMALVTSLAALCIDAVLPALGLIGQDFDVSAQDTHLIVSLFFIGMAFGQLFYGPFSDTKGRRYAIMSGIAVFAVGSLICMFSTSLEMMLAGRLIQAFGVSGPRIGALAMIRDQYEGDAMARVMSFIMMVFILVPMIAPLIGRGIMFIGSWHYIFVMFLVVGAIVGTWLMLRQPETLAVEDKKPFKWTRFFQSCVFVITHRLVAACTLSLGLIFGAFLAYISSSQTLLQTFYDVGELFVVYFALLAFSIGIASFINGKLVMRFGMRKLSQLGFYVLLVLSIMLTYAAWHFSGLPPLWMTLTLFFGMFFCVGILFGNLNAMAMEPLGHVAGLGAAIIGFGSSLFSVPIAVFVGSFLDFTILPIGVGFCVAVILSLSVLHWARSKPVIDA